MSYFSNSKSSHPQIFYRVSVDIVQQTLSNKLEI